MKTLKFFLTLACLFHTISHAGNINLQDFSLEINDTVLREPTNETSDYYLYDYKDMEIAIYKDSIDSNSIDGFIRKGKCYHNFNASGDKERIALKFSLDKNGRIAIFNNDSDVALYENDGSKYPQPKVFEPCDCEFD